MSLSTLSHILDFFSGKEPTPEERQDMVNETLMLVLSRATESDTNIHPVEVETVREMVQKRTGEDVTAAEVRVAAHSRIYESAPLENHVQRVARQLDVQDRVMIAKALAEVILVDGRVSGREVRFFNSIAGAMELTAADLAGLFATH